MKLCAKRIVLASLLVSSMSASWAKAPEPAPLDPAYAEIEGTWKVVALEAQGQEAPETIVAALKLIFQARTVTFEPAEPGFAHFTYKLNSKSKPASFDIISPAGPDAGRPQLGIYALQGDTLKICIGSQVRPKTFATKPESHEAMYTLRRIRQ